MESHHQKIQLEVRILFIVLVQTVQIEQLLRLAVSHDNLYIHIYI